ncbi:hypothetical protein BDV97DRAFT_353364 [Delphinella strobiligena]|nr:hypothetical protein BDV97DRAFT_353364 [Delphinella strobiligena]
MIRKVRLSRIHRSNRNGMSCSNVLNDFDVLRGRRGFRLCLLEKGRLFSLLGDWERGSRSRNDTFLNCSAAAQNFRSRNFLGLLEIMNRLPKHLPQALSEDLGLAIFLAFALPDMEQVAKLRLQETRRWPPCVTTSYIHDRCSIGKEHHVHIGKRLARIVFDEHMDVPDITEDTQIEFSAG